MHSMMGVLLLTGFLAVVAVVALIFLRGGPREPMTSEPMPLPRTAARQEVPGALSSGARAEQLVRALGLEIGRREADEGDGPAFVATEASSTNGQRIYVRVFDLPPGEHVRGPDVIAALDVARGEGFHKTLLISSNGFSDEAVLAAEGSIAELFDGERLDEILQGRGALKQRSS